MEKDPFEGYKPDLFPRLTRVADALSRLSFLPQVTLASHGDHLPREPQPPQLPFED